MSDYADHYSRAVRFHRDTETIRNLVEQMDGHDEHLQPGSNLRLIAADAFDEADRSKEAELLRSHHPIWIDDNHEGYTIKHAPTRDELASFIRGFKTTALWQATDPDTNGDPLVEDHYDHDQLHHATNMQMEEEAGAFLYEHRHLLGKGDNGKDFSHAGHDYALSRNGHGAGFFDGDYGGNERELQKWAKADGSYDLYRGDDGLIHAS